MCALDLPIRPDVSVRRDSRAGRAVIDVALACWLEVIELGEVCAEVPLVRVTRPLGEAGEVAGADRGDPAAHVDLRRALGCRSRQADAHETLDCEDEVVLARAGTLLKRSGQFAGSDRGEHSGDPQGGRPAKQQCRAGSDDRGQALHDIGVGQVGPDAVHALVGMFDWREAEPSILFHASVGPVATLKARGADRPDASESANGRSNRRSSGMSAARPATAGSRKPFSGRSGETSNGRSGERWSAGSVRETSGVLDRTRRITLDERRFCNP